MQFLTTRQAAELLNASEWQVRRAVDALPIAVDRFGGKRAIPRDALPDLAEAIHQRRSRSGRDAKENTQNANPDDLTNSDGRT